LGCVSCTRQASE